GAEVAGHVVDETGQGVQDVDVMISTAAVFRSARGPVAARTDGSGAFAIPDQPRQGVLVLEARGDGIAPSQPTRVTLPATGPVEIHVRRGRAIDGKVVDAGSNQPVSDAMAEASMPMQRRGGPGGFTMNRPVGTAFTDDTGAFHIDGLDVGSYTVTVTASGYKPTTVVADVPADGSVKSVTVAMKPGLTLHGMVVDGQGGPLPGVDVTASLAAPQAGGNMFATGASARTGPDGRFLVDGLEAGRYQLVAEDDTGAQARDVADAGRAEDVVLHLQSPGAIAGRVTAPDGAPVAGASVSTRGSGTVLAGGDVTTDAGGGFSIQSLAPGAYQVMARANGYGATSQDATVASGQTAQVALVLRAGGTVTGQITGLSPADLGSTRVMGGGASASPGTDGGFELDGVRVGTFPVTAMVSTTGRQRSANVTVADLDTPASVTLDFSTGITLSGTVLRAGRPAASLTVDAVAAGRRGGATALTDESGAWDIAGLDPGDYDVSALDVNGAALATQHVTAQADTRVDLVVPGGTLAGHVTDAQSGEPVSAAQVRSTLATDPSQVRTVVTDASGSFSITELADGAYALRVNATGYSPGEAQAVLADGQSDSVAVTLQPQQGLTLDVRDIDGSVPSQVNLVPMRNGVVEDPAFADTGSDGHAVFTTLVPGGYTVRVSSSVGQAILAVMVPSEVPVQLVQTGALLVAPPAAPAAKPWQVQLVSGGLVVPVPAWQNPGRGAWVPLGAGGMRQMLPSGACTVQTLGPDGVVHEQTVVVPPGGQVSVRPEGP
ncbi:MAG TPA: carboxypeptidase regulatory-like domain-containing protein, partial [Thermoanaerobaculaceae bacterium]|nr:carboxypeptidase regulatory-like domain-containing protein [Thermoanaerobaculaceae bacterium]